MPIQVVSAPLASGWRLMPDNAPGAATHGNRVPAGIEATQAPSLVFTDPAIIGHHVSLQADLRPTPACASALLVDHAGGSPLARLTADGTRAVRLRADDVSLEQLDDGFVRVLVKWRNRGESIALRAGPKRGAQRLASAPEWEVRSVLVDVGQPLTPPAHAPLVFLDIGARGGVAAEIARHADGVMPVLVEPDPVEAERIRRMEAAWFPEVQILPFALGDADMQRTLYVTRAPSCSSLLRPNPAVTSRYPGAALFDVVGETGVACRRFDGLVAEGQAPSPHYVKLDVQGFEYQILEGFGSVLDSVIAVQLECHAYELYTGQRLLGDVIALLDKHGLALRALKPQNASSVFAGEFVEFNAWFLRRPGSWSQGGADAEQKLALSASLIPV